MNSEYQEYRENWETFPKEHIVSAFPLHLYLELTSRCNLKCPICPYHSKDAPYPVEDMDMDFNLYRKIIKEGAEKGLKSVKLSFSGEPLLYEKLVEAIVFAKQYGIIDVMLNTNGLQMNNKIINSFITSGLDLVILTDYDINLQYQNAVEFQTVKRLFGHKKPKLRVKTFNPEKWKGVVDEITKPMNHDYHNLYETIEVSEFECSDPWRCLGILADGTVLRCGCGTLKVDKIMGNAHWDDIEKLWHSEYMKYLRFCNENHRTDLVSSCLDCPARIKYINENK